MNTREDKTVDITPIIHPNVWREMLDRWDVKGITVNDAGSFVVGDHERVIPSLVQAVHQADLDRTMVIPSNAQALRTRVRADIEHLADGDLTDSERRELVEDVIDDINQIADAIEHKVG